MPVMGPPPLPAGPTGRPAAAVSALAPGLPEREADARTAPTPATAPAIGLLGQFGSGNSGNDGSLAAMIAYLRRVRPDADLLCICSDPEVVEREHGIRAVRIHCGDLEGRSAQMLDRLLRGVPRRFANWTQAIRITRGLDVVLIPGTGILDDFQESPMGWPYTLFRWCAATRLTGGAVGFVSIGAGPIRHRLSRWFMSRAAGLAAYRSYRDEDSKRYMRSIGFDSSADPVYPDLVFGLPVPARPRAAKRSSSNLTVGVGVMAYSGWRKGDAQGAAIYRDYLAKICRFVCWLLDQGHGVRLLTGDERDVDAVADLLAMPELAGRADAAAILAEPTASLTELMRQIAQTDIVVASRFHNVVCALKLTVPTISISYAPKNDALQAAVGMDEFCQPIDHLNTDLLVEQFHTLVARLDDCRAGIRAGVDRLQANLAEQGESLSERFLVSRNHPDSVLWRQR